MLSSQIQNFLIENSYGPLIQETPVSGGCISNAKIITTKSGTTFFLKHNPDTPHDMFAREAKGLDALRVNGGPTVPQAYLHGSDFILLAFYA